MAAQGGALHSMWLRAPLRNRRAILLMCYGPEFVAKAVRAWITAVGSKYLHIMPGSPCEDGQVESFNARLCDELLSGEIVSTLKEAQIVTASGRLHDNAVSPHASLRYRQPAP